MTATLAPRLSGDTDINGLERDDDISTGESVEHCVQVMKCQKGIENHREISCQRVMHFEYEECDYVLGWHLQLWMESRVAPMDKDEIRDLYQGGEPMIFLGCYEYIIGRAIEMISQYSMFKRLADQTGLK